MVCVKIPDMESKRQVIIHEGEDGYWVAECPSLPGCVSQGKTEDEATENIKEAISAYIEALNHPSKTATK